MKRIFASGTCRLLTCLHNGRELCTPIHSSRGHVENMGIFYTGINFLGKLHNTKHHIQFIKWLLDEITIPEKILSKFLVTYTNVSGIEDKDNSAKKIRIKNSFKKCDVYIFEISSIKIHEIDGYQVHYELSNDHTEYTQTEDELLNDLKTLISLIPTDKKIIFQCHFRPNIIYNNPSMSIENREIIYNALCRLSSPSVIIHDPSHFIKENPEQFIKDDGHFTGAGIIENFNKLCNLF